MSDMRNKWYSINILYRKGLLLSVSGPSRPVAAPGSQPCAPLLPAQQPAETRSCAGQHATWIRRSKRVRGLCNDIWVIYIFVHYNLFCFSLSSCLCISRALRSVWFFSSSSAVLQLSHCLSFSNSSSFRVSSSSTCSSSMVHVVFRVSMFYTHTYTKYAHSQINNSFWLIDYSSTN